MLIDYNLLPETETETAATTVVADKTEKKSSNGGAANILFKAMVGSGILSLPSAFKSFGIAGSIVFMLMLALPSWYSMHLLLKCLHRVRDRGSIAGEISYELLCVLGIGPWSMYITSFSVITAQLGSVIAYLVFVQQSLGDVLQFPNYQVSPLEVMVYTAPIYIGTCWLKNTDSLSWTSQFGNISLISGIIAVVYYGLAQEIRSPIPLKDYVLLDWSGLSTFFGVCLFAFAAHAEILMIEQSIKSRGQKDAFRTTFVQVFSFVIVLYILFGGGCYIFFGSNTPDIIFEAMPPADVLTKLVKIFMSISLLFQYPVTLFPAFFIVEPKLFGDYDGLKSNKENRMHYRLLLRTLICIFTAAISLVLPFFTKLMALIGAFSTGVIVFVLPPLLHLKVYGPELSSLHKAIDVSVIVFGMSGSLFASAMIALSIAASLRDGH